MSISLIFLEAFSRFLCSTELNFRSSERRGQLSKIIGYAKSPGLQDTPKSLHQKPPEILWAQVGPMLDEVGARLAACMHMGVVPGRLSGAPGPSRDIKTLGSPLSFLQGFSMPFLCFGLFFIELLFFLSGCCMSGTLGCF